MVDINMVDINLGKKLKQDVELEKAIVFQKPEAPKKIIKIQAEQVNGLVLVRNAINNEEETKLMEFIQKNPGHPVPTNIHSASEFGWTFAKRKNGGNTFSPLSEEDYLGYPDWFSDLWVKITMNGENSGRMQN